MLAAPEHYKGMVYVRLSALPVDQRNNFRRRENREKIIKILKDKSLMNDCVLYEDYLNCVQAKDVNPVEASRAEGKELVHVSALKSV
jgi:hypothetical protein